MPEERKQDVADTIQAAWARERPAMPVDSIGVITRVWHAAKLLGDERRRTLARLGIDAATLDLLSTLRRHGPPYAMPPAQLRTDSLLTAGAVTQRVTRAEKHGLVRTVRGPRGRTSSVELNESGHRLIEHTVERLLTYENSLLDDLTGPEREQLADLLRKLLNGLNTRLGTPSKPGQVGEPPLGAGRAQIRS
jgi:DNA-binding MarR family transcriptional regulator